MNPDPTLTPELNPVFSILFLLATVLFTAVELLGVWRKDTGDTFTEHWRWAEAAMPRPLAWIFRVGTGGLLVWALLHFLAGAA